MKSRVASSNDGNDAEAICTAARQAQIPFVPKKNVEQEDIQGSRARPQRLRRALGAGQIVDDRGGVLRRYRSLVNVDHLIHDLLPNVPRQRGLIQV